MKKFFTLMVVMSVVSILSLSAFSQAQDCFSCQTDDEWLGAVTKMEVTVWDEQGRASAIDIFLELKQGWNGKDENGCCTIWENVITQSCVQFGVWNIYFGSDVTGWGWDFNHDRKIDEAEWMPHNEHYWAEWDLDDETVDKYIIIHGIPLNKGVLEGNIFIITPHGEIIYFIPSEIKRCDEYARGDSYGAGEFYVNFWSKD